MFGPWITELWLQLAECETFSDRIRVATETVLPFAAQASPPTRAMAAAQTLFQTDFGLRIQELAQDACMSVRTYERKFLAEMGLSPKLFARLRRFQRALDRKRAFGRSWLEVAHELGYFDQMHMVKDFQALGGEAPSRLLQSCGDFQPWSIGGPLSRHPVTTREFPHRSSRGRSGLDPRGRPDGSLDHNGSGKRVAYRVVGRESGMYGPPPCCKRKVK